MEGPKQYAGCGWRGGQQGGYRPGLKGREEKSCYSVLSEEKC